MSESQAYALLIGIAAYRHLRTLSKATIDAQDLHGLLGQSGYPPSNLGLLLDELDLHLGSSSTSL